MSDAAQVQRRVTRIGELRPLQLIDSPDHNTSSVAGTSAGKPPKAVLKRRFPVNNNKLSFEAKGSPEKRLKPLYGTPLKLSTTPKADYHEFLALDQAGDAHIANDNTTSCNLVAIKTYEWNGDDKLECCQQVRHDNIVHMLEIFRKDKRVCIVYEQMDVSLRLINSLPRGSWQPFEIAAICKEVLSGISFIHEQLRMYHGAITCGTIMLGRDGYIKLGYVMVELMEHETSIRHPGKIDLARPEAWKEESGIKSFLAATQTDSLAKLKKQRSITRYVSRSEHELDSATGWLRRTFVTSDTDILDRHGLDAYCFLRFLRTIVQLFTTLAAVILPILLPLHLVHGKGSLQGVQGLDRLSIANVGVKNSSFYWGHLTISAAGIALICFFVYREFEHFIHMRSIYLQANGKHYQTKPTAILLSDIPNHLLNIQSLRSLYEDLPGGVCAVIINRDYAALTKQITARDQTVEALELAETKLLLASVRKGQPPPILLTSKRPLTSQERDWIFSNGRSPRPQLHVGNNGSRIPLIPFLGKNVDAIDHFRATIEELNDKIKLMQSNPNAFTFTNSAFIVFNKCRAAELASHSPGLYYPRQMTPRYIGTSTDDVIWSAIGTSWLSAQFGSLAVAAVIALLCIGWTIPVALTGIMSQITYLTQIFPWLQPINRLPPFFVGSLQGFFPQILLTISTAMLPVLIRSLVERQGSVVGREIELTVQTYYFWFLFIQIFLTVSLSSSAVTIMQQALERSSTIPNLLATNLPKTSNYFFSYLLLQAFSTSGSTLLQLPGLLSRTVIGPLTDATPRQIVRRRMNFQESQWGTYFPIYTNMACIGELLF
ncbi:MAG: hypothetical protein Q9179_000292 [Wetmoreana sp. 5 TL-2023]